VRLQPVFCYVCNGGGMGEAGRLACAVQQGCRVVVFRFELPIELANPLLRACGVCGEDLWECRVAEWVCSGWWWRQRGGSEGASGRIALRGSGKGVFLLPLASFTFRLSSWFRSAASLSPETQHHRSRLPYPPRLSCFRQHFVSVYIFFRAFLAPLQIAMNMKEGCVRAVVRARGFKRKPCDNTGH